MYYRFIALIIVLTLGSCSSESITIPKERIYPKVTYPQRNYVAFQQNYCSFVFEHPDYMVFKHDSLLVAQQNQHPCWFTLELAAFNGSLHFTYTDISGKDETERIEKLHKVIKDAYTLSDKHNGKATGRETDPFVDTTKSLYGIKYKVDGDVASPYHFILTDSLNHAVWGSLYFKVQPDADSLRPIVDFVQEDIEKMMNSVRWVK